MPEEETNQLQAYADFIAIDMVPDGYHPTPTRQQRRNG